MADGVLLLDKPAGITSFDAVARVRRLYGTRQVGHTGTLDPLATGLLVMMVGSAVKAAEYLAAEDKEYLAGMRLGLTTDTEDITGKTLTETAVLPPKDEVLRVVASFRGAGEQVPPMVSALKVGGQKLLDLARRGVTVERQARPITVYALDADGDGADYTLRAHVSKGTYIRTLCADIGQALGCGAVMSSLRRTRSGTFLLDDAVTPDALDSMDSAAREALLRPTESLFETLAPLRMPAFYENLAKNGCEIYLRKLGISLPLGTRLRICDKEGFFAVGEVRDYPDGAAIRLVKRFGR